MSHPPTSHDDVTPPAADTRLFRSSPTLTFLIIFLTGWPVMMVVTLLIRLTDGDPASWRQVGEAAANSLSYTMVAGVVAAWAVHSRRTWVRTSAGGIEVAAHGGDPILLDWSEIVSARIRGRWLWAVLDVVPADPDAVRGVEPRRDLPRMRVTADGIAFVVKVGGLRPGPTALRAELAHRTQITRHR